MDQHVYEDPDAMLPCDTTLTVPRDYRESPVTSSVSPGNRSGAFQQKLSKECSPKPTKKWNIKLRVNKNKGSGEISRKPNKGGKEGKKGVKKANSDSSLKKGQTKSEGRKILNRGGSDYTLYKQDSSALEITEVTDHFYEIADEDSSPPPALPSRGYLMDEEFTVELNALERQLADINTESEEDDDYTAMATEKCYENFVDTKTFTHQDLAATPSEVEDGFHTPPVPKRHYTLSDSNRDEIKLPRIPKRQYTEDTPLIPGRCYENFTDTNSQDVLALLDDEEDNAYVPCYNKEPDEYINVPTCAGRGVETSSCKRGDQSESDDEYAYVLPDVVRSARRMMGRKAGRTRKK